MKIQFTTKKSVWKWGMIFAEGRATLQAVEKKLKKFRLDREPNPVLYNDRTQRSIHWAIFKPTGEKIFTK